MSTLGNVSSTLLLVIAIFSTIERSTATCPKQNYVIQESGNDTLKIDCDSNSLGDTCTYTSCQEGYGGADTAVCLTSGKWSNEFSCLKVTCPEETNLNHGSISCQEADYGETCSYKCDSFYGSGQKITCEADGQWSPTPVCAGSSLFTSLYVIALASLVQQLILSC